MGIDLHLQGIGRRRVAVRARLRELFLQRVVETNSCAAGLGRQRGGRGSHLPAPR